MARDKTKTGHAQISQAIVELDQKIQLIELMKDGVSAREMAEQLHISDSTLKALKASVLGELTEDYTSAVDEFRMIAFARYERLFKIADGLARGVQSGVDEDGEALPPGEPDKNWFDRTLAVLDAEQRLLKYDLDNLSKRKDDKSRINLTKISQVTLNSNDPMAKMAIEAMQQEWLAGGEDPQTLLLAKVKDAQAGAEDDLIFGEFPEDLTLDSLEEQLEEMQKRLKSARGEENA